MGSCLGVWPTAGTLLSSVTPVPDTAGVSPPTGSLCPTPQCDTHGPAATEEVFSLLSSRISLLYFHGTTELFRQWQSAFFLGPPAEICNRNPSRGYGIPARRDIVGEPSPEKSVTYRLLKTHFYPF